MIKLYAENFITYIRSILFLYHHDILGMLVPDSITTISKLHSAARYILVIEKDATFQKLIEKKFHHTYGPCILITVSKIFATTVEH